MSKCRMGEIRPGAVKSPLGENQTGGGSHVQIKKVPRHYSDEFKRSAVSLVLDEKKSVSKVAGDLGKIGRAHV